MEDGRKVVVLTAGTTEWFAEIANAVLAEQELGLAGCLEEYVTYVATGIVENSNRARSRLPARAVAYFAAYASTSSGHCRNFVAASFDTRQDLGELRARMVESSIAFFYLHELGHHVLGHTSGLALTPVNGLVIGSDDRLAMTRAQEDAADRWAIRTALRARYDPAVASPAFLLIASTGGDSLESERHMDHPLGARRFLTMYNEVYAYYEAHPEAWTGSEPYSSYMAELRQHQQALQHILDMLAHKP
jgi:hypothetical protein